MSTIGQAIGGILGAAAGFIIGGGPVGALIGFQIGLGIGSFIDPPSTDDPTSPLQLQDLQFNTFQRNLPVPIVYGTNRVAGNIIWLGNTRSEVIVRSAGGGGGKGGRPEPPKVREIWYHADFAMALSEGEIAGVVKVLIDEEDISAREGLSYFVHKGTDAETQDSRITSALGSTLAPFFRRTAYLMVTGKLGQINRIPVVQADTAGILAADPIFVDVFSRSNANSLGPNWSIVGGNGFKVLSNQARVLTVTANSITRVAVTSEAYEPRLDMRVSATIADLAPQNQFFGLDARVQSGGAAYSIVSTWDVGKARAQLVRWTNPTTYVTLTSAKEYNIYQGQELAVRVKGPEIFGEVGGRVFLSASDGNIIEPGLAGMMARITVTNCTLALDRFSAGRPVTRPVSKFFFADLNFASSWTSLGSHWVQNGIRAVAVFPSGFRVDSSQAIVAGNNPNRAVTVAGVADGHPDVTITAKVVNIPVTPITSGEQNFLGYGLQARVQGDDQAYGVHFSRTNVSCTTQAQVYISRWLGPESRTIVASTVDTLVSCGNRIGLKIVGGTIQALVNDFPALTGFDTTIVSAGGAGLVSGTEAPSRRFDDIAVTAAAANTTFASAPEATPANPVLCVRDLLLNTRYGLGLDESKLDQPSFEIAASYCDEYILSTDGALEKRFELDIVLDTQRTILDHLRDILGTFRGFLVWSQGVIKMRIEKDEDVSQSFDMSSIVADSFSWRRQSYRDRPNVIRIEYINENDEYRHDFVEAFDDWDIDLSGERRERTVRLLGIKRSTQAMRMAQFYLDQAIHVTTVISFRVGIAALKAEVGDVVEVSHDIPGWVAKKFRIIQINEAENDELLLTCLEYNPAVYHDEGVTVQNPYGTLVINPFETPYHVIRLTSHKRPNENVIELAYTRANCLDQLAGAQVFRRRGNGDFEELESTLALAPTAFLNSRVETFVQNSAGASTVTCLFSDLFNRPDEALVANSRWQGQFGSYSLVNCAVEFPTLTASRCVSRVLSGGAVLTAAQVRQELDVKFGVLAGSGDLIEHGLIARYANGANFYAAIMGVQSGGTSVGYLRMLKRIASVDSNFVALTSFGIQAGQVYTMKYDLRSYTHRLFIDNSLWISKIDCSFVASGSHGLFGQITSVVGSTGAFTKDNYHYRDVPFGDLEIQATQDPWSVKVFDHTSATIVSAVASDGTMVVPLTDVVDSGTIVLFDDRSFFLPVTGGRYPATGNTSISPAGLYTFDRSTQFVTHTQTFIPIYNALGGFANVASARINDEQFGYATFTDSRLEGVARGGGGTTATSHTAVLTLGALVVTSGDTFGLVDVTSAGRDHLSNVNVFVITSAHVYIGASSKFPRIGVHLARIASSPLSLYYEYSTGDATWATLTESGFLGPTDQTSGFTRSGKILLEPPGDWFPTNRATATQTLADATSRYYVRIQRTNTVLDVGPREMLFTVDGETVVTVRNTSRFEYEPILADSATALSFKAVAIGFRGQLAEGTKAPITNPVTV